MTGGPNASIADYFLIVNNSEPWDHLDQFTRFRGNSPKRGQSKTLYAENIVPYF